MDDILIGIGLFVLVIAGFLYALSRVVTVEVAECMDVERLMVVQHFNAPSFMQIVDTSLYEQHGFVKLDQYFTDEPFTQEEMLSAGFALNLLLEETGPVYWRVVKNATLTHIKGKDDYWTWGSEDG